MMRLIAQSRRRDRATLWLINSLFLWLVPLLSIQGVWISKWVPWWCLGLVVLASSVWLTKIQITRGESGPVTRVTVLWLGVVPIRWLRYGPTVFIAAGCSDMTGDEPDEVSFGFQGSSWSFGSSQAAKLADWLRDAQSELAKPG